MRILYVTSRHPLPPWRGNQIRVLQWLEALTDHEVTLACPRADRSVGPSLEGRVVTWNMRAGAITTGLVRAAVSGRPLQEGMYAVPQAVRTVRTLLGDGRWDLVVVQMVRCGWAFDQIPSGPDRPAVLFDAVDSMGLHFQRAAEGSSFVRSWSERIESRRCRRREAALAQAADGVVAVCRRDVDALGGRPERRVVVPVAAAGPPEDPPVCSEPVVAFTGNLGYRPTRTAVRWFADEVWPRVVERVPGCRWVIAGARPGRDVRSLARRAGVEVRADVSDLASVLRDARVAVAPMATGSGIPMKVLEAWAAGVPVVATPRAVESLEGGLQACEVRRGDDVEGWTESIVRLLTDTPTASDLARRGRRAWASVYAPEPVARAVRQAVASTVARHRGLS